MNTTTRQAIIFDMDGTLWNAVDSILESRRYMQKSIPEVDLSTTKEQLFALMGQTMDVYARTLYPQIPFEEACRIMELTDEGENKYLTEHGAHLYGDIRSLFEQLHQRDLLVMIVSNAQKGYIEAFLNHYSLWDLVDDFVDHGDNGLSKAENIRLVMERNHVDSAWYVGDTQSDLEACSATGVPFIYASYGFGSPESFDCKIDRLEDILKLKVL